MSRAKVSKREVTRETVQIYLEQCNIGYGSFISQSIIQNMRYGLFAEDGLAGSGINLFARPLGNVIYLMTSQITTPERVKQCEQILLKCLQQ